MNQERLTINELLDLPEEQQCSEETLQKLSTIDLKKLLKSYNMDEENCQAIESVLNLRTIGSTNDIPYPTINTGSIFFKIMRFIVIVVVGIFFMGLLGAILSKMAKIIGYVIMSAYRSLFVQITNRFKP